MKYSLALAMTLVTTPVLAQFPNATGQWPNVTGQKPPVFYPVGGFSLSRGGQFSSDRGGFDQPRWRRSTNNIQIDNRQPHRIQKGLTAYDILMDQMIRTQR